MKPKNFPARKLARQIAADMRRKGLGSLTAECIYTVHGASKALIGEARKVRTKKRRGG